jgi:hypothetical protein
MQAMGIVLSAAENRTQVRYVTTADSQVLSEVETTSQSQAPSNGSESSPDSAKMASSTE